MTVADHARRSAKSDLAALTHERVMRAVAALLTRSSEEVTFERVAAESGIPQRTLYRHFANKDALFGAFWPWMNALIEVPQTPLSAAEITDHIPALFAAFDRQEPLVRAMLHSPHGRAVRLAHNEARRDKFAEALKAETILLSEANARRLLAGVTALCSAAGWETIKDYRGLSGAKAADAAQWSVKSLIEAARRG